MKAKATGRAKGKKAKGFEPPTRNYLKEWWGAAAREAELRDMAFVEGPYLIAGAPIRLMRMRDYQLLSTLRSPLITGQPADPYDIANFLWILSYEFCDDPEAKAKWLSALPDAEDGEVTQALTDYLDLIFLDKPGSSGDAKNPGCSGFAMVMDFFITEYRWTEEQISNTPLPRLFQYQRAAQTRCGGKVPMFNRMADRAAGAYIDARNLVPEQHRDAWHQWQVDQMKGGANGR